MIFHKLRAAHRRRVALLDPQSGFAMFIALLLIMIIAGMSLLVTGFVLSENKPVQTARKTVGTVNAAEAGFEIALTQLRAATDVYGNGNIAKLPCTASAAPGTPITGSVGPNTGASNATTLTYKVYVRYYLDDPTTLGTSDLSSDSIACAGGQPTSVPKYAYLTSNGVGSTGASAAGTSSQNNRALHTTYQFKTSNLNFAGGRLNMNGTTFCMDSGTAPDVGTLVTLTTCQNRGVLPSQSSWAYRADLTIELTTSPDPGLCVTAANGTGTSLAARLTLQPCATDGTGGATYPYAASPSLQRYQEWSFDDNGKFEGANTDGTTNGLCISTNPYASPSAGGSLYEQGCSNGGFDTMTWNPDAQVGAGPAGNATQQLVNYYEFGRCLDVTGTDVNATNLITYPCKQAPNPANILWNQRWAYSGTQSVAGSLGTNNGSPYCLQGPDTLSAVFSSNLVLTKSCNSATATQKWIERGNVVGDYGSSYTITNNFGACLSLGPSLLSGYNNQWSTIIVETCDGSLKQKWNAPANFVDSRFKGTGEDQGGQS